ncbi:hypothetical protein PoB_003160100 [Plakobranchus ocellatus]|uniref:Uncharacterized protein n=1 Tax=Plakobranchus ocellatus TaxID=259542 RepID=A0AAV4A1K1_9GAST|nr:hypothetical protein PoB_003160100 [Plakobranchus ocellatus]
MGLTKCADYLLLGEYKLPWDSAYPSATANFFVLPPGRKISVQKCDMSATGENMAYWISQSRESKRVWIDLPFIMSSSNAFTLMITFDNQKSMMGVYYLFLRTLDWSKAPSGLFLCETIEGGKSISEFSAPRALSRDSVMYVSTDRFSSEIAFRCDQNTVCANGINWTAAHL